MDTQLRRDSREKVVENPEEGKIEKEEKEKLPEKQQKQVPLTSPASSPSPSSSPSHEFSFTVSLNSSFTPVPDKAKSPSSSSSIAIDLSPADDIFFHGHLLPLHLLAHLPESPRSSTNSLDSFTLPINDLLGDQKPNKSTNNCRTGDDNSTYINENISKNESNILHQSNNSDRTRGRNKPNPLSLFGWRKGYEVTEKEDKEKQKKKPKFDVSHVIKRYVRMVRPLLFFKGRRENLQLHKQTYSFSGESRNKHELRERRGGFSAPASMRTSPTNSGHLVATAATLPSSTSDSTMEELQAAIQAAIAHCKKSIAAEEKINC